ncbi:MAG TPA: alkaline phosphatase family protein [Chthoniobacteraceae bacterium]|nr:alkaline phosphatase family protein [Chthoniobacteraceae bacterium]
MNPSAPLFSKRALLVGWEGVDWSFLKPLCEKGVLPALTAITRAGVSVGLQTGSPGLSPILWNNLVTGMRPWRHGVHGPAQVDAQGRAGPVSSGSRRVPALWERFSMEGLKTIVVGGYASHPAEPGSGIAVSERFFPASSGDGAAPAQSVWPPELAGELEELRVHPATLAPSLLRLLVPSLTQSLVERDPRLRRLALHVAKLYSGHNVAASLLETEPWDLAVVHFPFLGEIFGEFGSFASPRRPDVSRGAFERYSGLLEGACRLQDHLLGDLLKAAGPETTVFVVSDRGTDTSVPGGELTQKGREGILAASGPGIQTRPGILSGADLLDVAPTLLHAMSLPVGEGMEGRVLGEVLTEDALSRPARLPSAETRRNGSTPVCDPSFSPEDAETVRLQNGWNEGMDLLDAGLPHRALPLLEQAAWANPEAAHHRFWLALCQARLDLLTEAGETMGTLADLGEHLPSTQRLQALLSMEMQQPGRALVHLEAALARQKDQGGDLATLKATALQQSGKWLEALELLHLEATRRPGVDVWLGIAHGCLSLKRFEAAVSAARQLLRTAPCRPGSWLLLARCLVADGKRDEGWNALLRAQQMQPGSPEVSSMAGRLFPERRRDWNSWPRVAGPGENDPQPGVKELRAGSRRRKAAWERRLSEKRRRSSPSGRELPGPVAGIAEGLSYTYRAPFTDEEERALEILKKHPPMVGESFLRVWEIARPSRFAGAACWTLPAPDEPEPSGEVRFDLLPGFRTPGMAVELLRPLFAEMRASRCRKVRVLTSERAEWEPVLGRFGLRCNAWDEIWLADAVDCDEQSRLKAAGWEKKIPPGWKVRSITASDWSFIKLKSGALDFLSEDHLEKVRRGLDERISCVVESPAGPVGVLLATRFDMTAVLEFLGVAREASRHGSRVTRLALARFLRRDHPDPVDWVLVSTNPNKGDAARLLLRHFGSTLLQVVDHFTGELSEPPQPGKGGAVGVT